jgi:phosphate:Na+ symporter
VANVIIFLPFAGLLGRFVTLLVPDKKIKEVGHLTYLDVRMLDTPSLSIVQSLKQITFMGESVIKMMTRLRTCLESPKIDLEDERKIFHREEILDNVQKEIFVFLSHLVSGQVPHEVTRKSHMQMRMADEYETISDYAASVLKGIKKLEDLGLPLDEPARKKLLALHDRVAAYILEVNQYVTDGQTKDILPRATSEGAAISALMKDFRRQHLERLQNEEVSPFFSLAFTDILNYYRRMKDHALNIAEVIAGEK